MTFFPLEEQFKHKVPESLVCLIEEAQVETSPNNPLTQLNSIECSSSLFLAIHSSILEYTSKYISFEERK